jgi:hypothetical protein
MAFGERKRDAALSFTPAGANALVCVADGAGLWSPLQRLHERTRKRRSPYYCRIDAAAIAGIFCALLFLLMSPAAAPWTRNGFPSICSWPNTPSQCPAHVERTRCWSAFCATDRSTSALEESRGTNCPARFAMGCARALKTESISPSIPARSTSTSKQFWTEYVTPELNASASLRRLIDS